MIRIRTVVDGVRDLRLRPSRNVLAGISLIIGVVAVIATVVAGAVTRDVFVAAAEQRTARAYTYAQDLPPRTVSAATLDQIRASAGQVAPGVTWAVICVPNQTFVGVGGDPANTTLSPHPITLVGGDLPGLRRLPMLAGAWFDDAGVYPPALVLNQPAAARFGGVGTRMQIAVDRKQAPVTVTVTGVVADGSQGESIYMSLATALALRPALNVSGQTVLAHHPTDVARATHLLSVLTTTFDPGSKSPPRRYDEVGDLATQLDRVRLIFMITALVALALGLFGMLNVGLASVSERSHELVVRRATGARRIDLFGLVLVGSLLTGLIAAVLGTAIALAADLTVVPRLIDPATAIQAPPFPWEAAGWGALAALLTTVLAGTAPAAKAARLDIALALRD